MAFLDDIHSIMRTAQSAKANVSNLQHKSMARGAMDGTLQFPNLVSDAIPIDMASTVSRTLERVYASFVQMYLSMNNTVDISIDKNPTQYLKRFHNNIKVESTAEDLYRENCIESDEEYKSLMERIYDGTTKAFINESENKMIIFNFSDKFNKSVYDANKVALEKSLKDIDFLPFPNIGNSPFYEANSQTTFQYGDNGPTMNQQFSMNIPSSIEDDHELSMHRMKNQIADDIKVKGSQAFMLRNNDKLRVPAMTDNDVKKSNDLQPYLMQVRLMAVNDQNEFVQFMDFIVGVKVVMHNIKSNEMIANLQNTLQNNGKLFNFIRWTTGEKSLFKDLILHINDVKLDVANRSMGTSPWWTTLKRLRNTSKAQSAFFSRTQIVPNSTITVSSYEVDIIQKNYGANLHDPRFAKKIMSALFLMNFVIVDDGTRTVEVLYDGSNTFQTYALETFEREVSMNSNKIGKELTRMISR